jgi:four helix bundle protein
MREDKNADLKDRTKQLGLRTIRLVRALPKGMEGRVLGGQLLRAATSVGANYRAACRSRSVAEFIAKTGVVEEEADECCFWLEMIVAAGLMQQALVGDLLKEADELTAIMTASRKTAQRRKNS